jgi:hypothetical protein
VNPPLKYVIWSEQHGGWWAHDRNGYTRYLTNAGRYSKTQAHEIVTNANQYSKTWNELAIPDPLNLLTLGLDASLSTPGATTP